jgi:hypothetical protein
MNFAPTYCNNKLKVMGMRAKKYHIYYYDASDPTTPLPYGNEGYQTEEWSPN